MNIFIRITIFLVLVSWLQACSSIHDMRRMCYKATGKGGQQFEVECK